MATPSQVATALDVNGFHQLTTSFKKAIMLSLISMVHGLEVVIMGCTILAFNTAHILAYPSLTVKKNTTTIRTYMP